MDQQQHEQVISLLDLLTTAYQQIMQEQSTLILDLGYTAQDRLQLSITLAQQFYAEGFPPLSREQVQLLFREGDLQALLFILLCGGSIRQTGQSRLLLRPGFLAALHQMFPQKESANAPLSKLPPDQRTNPALPGRRLRSRRTPSRVGEQYTRRLPEPDLPA